MIGVSSNGKTLAFGASYRGSNPCTPALRARVGQVVSPADCKSVASGCVGSIPTPST